MQLGMIHRLIHLLQQAFASLDVPIDLEQVEQLAVLVHKGMTLQTRNYHNLEHVFHFIELANPQRNLAALFHDIVYYQVDPGLLPEIRRVIAPYILEAEQGISLRGDIAPQERLVWMTLRIFDLSPGKRLTPAEGLNEFLSALVMNKKLEGLLQEKDLLKMTVCIEATIPFRGMNRQGDSHFHVLARRLRKVSEIFDIPLSWPEIDESIQQAVRFANSDVQSFAVQDPGVFLNNTWKLLPETNVALRSREVYSVREYRQAIQAMEGFLSRLDPDNVFHAYQGVPPDEQFRLMGLRAHQNIFTARQYLRVKLLGQAVLEALAQVTGGDAPLCLFMGDLPGGDQPVQRMEDFLPVVEAPSWIDPSAAVYQLLDAGRQGNSTFDLKTAPLSLFIYKSLEPEKFASALQLSREMFDGQISSQQFLKQLPAKMVSAIANACAVMAITRSEQLMRYVSE